MDEIPVKVGNETVWVRKPRSTVAFNPDYQDKFEGMGQVVSVLGKLYEYFKGNLFPVQQQPTPPEWIDRKNPDYQESIYEDKPMGITAAEITDLWHGSPYKFDKVYMSINPKLTHEAGSYWTKSKEYAKEYAENYLYEGTALKGTNIGEEAFIDWWNPVDGKNLDLIMNAIKKEDPSITKDMIYEFAEDAGNIKGHDLINFIKNMMGKGLEGTKRFLGNLGFKGIKYQSTAADTKNFIIFNEKDITINKRYKKRK